MRAEIAGLDLPEVRLRSHRADRLQLLVLGGSQGAAALNEILPGLASRLGLGMDLHIWHQAGTRHYEATRKSYIESGADPEKVRVVPFIEDMAAAYDWADLVICRAGALTLAELCIAGIASVLVPYPHAVDDHQTANAEYLVAHGCAILLPEQGMDPHRLAGILTDFHCSREKLLGMAQRARRLARPDATSTVARLCLEFADA